MAKETPFHKTHEQHEAEFAEHYGWQVPQHYGDPEGELQAAYTSLAVFDLSFYTRYRVSGVETAEAISPLLDQDVEDFVPGRQYEGNLINPEGKRSGLTVQVHGPESLLLICAPEVREDMESKLNSACEKHRIRCQDETDSTAMVRFIGPHAFKLFRDKLPIDVSHLQPSGIMTANLMIVKFTLALDSEHMVTLTLPANIAAMAWTMLERYGEHYEARLAGYQTYQNIFSPPGEI